MRSTDTANRFQALRQVDTSSKAVYLDRIPVGMPGSQVRELRLPETDDLAPLLMYPKYSSLGLVSAMMTSGRAT